MTNRLYVARRLRTRLRFSHYMERFFGTEVRRTAFNRPGQAARLINGLVRNDTNGTIDTLIQPRECRDGVRFQGIGKRM